MPEHLVPFWSVASLAGRFFTLSGNTTVFGLSAGARRLSVRRWRHAIRTAGLSIPNTWNWNDAKNDNDSRMEFSTYSRWQRIPAWDFQPAAVSNKIPRGISCLQPPGTESRPGIHSLWLPVGFPVWRRLADGRRLFFSLKGRYAGMNRQRREGYININ